MRFSGGLQILYLLWSESIAFKILTSIFHILFIYDLCFILAFPYVIVVYAVTEFLPVFAILHIILGIFVNFGVYRQVLCWGMLFCTSCHMLLVWFLLILQSTFPFSLSFLLLYNNKISCFTPLLFFGHFMTNK